MALVNNLNIQLSSFDRRRGLIIPTKITEDLAYLCGVLAGDGNINVRMNKHDYCIKCVGNPKDEKGFYNLIIKAYFQKLFHVSIKPKLLDKNTTYGFVLWSKTLVRFFNESIGLPIGSKYEKIKVPIIFKNNEKYLTSFIRGMADTDFCIALKRRYKKKRYYPVIVGVSKSKRLINEIAESLEKFGFVVSRHFDRIQYDKRVNKYITTHVIQLYGHSQLVKWMRVIGFKNLRHLNKFKLWFERNKRNPWARKEIEEVAGEGFEPST